MEEVEATVLENRIGWLAETIVESLLNDQLEEWIRQVGLAGHTEKLISEIERVKGVVADVKGRAIGSRLLARELGRLRDLLYDADEAVDDLDYFRLQQQVQGDERRGPEDAHGEQPTGNTAALQEGTDGSEQVDESNGDTVMSESNTDDKSGSFVWQHFVRITDANGKLVRARCKYCHKTLKCPTKNGTNSLIRHYNSRACNKKRGATEQQPILSSAGESPPNDNSAATGSSVGREGMRIDHETANAHTWNKAELSNGIQHITHQLQEFVNKIVSLGRPGNSNQGRHISPPATNATTSYLPETKVYGRDAEMESILKLVMNNRSNGITVLPIVGIGGIGKTTMAQLIYNHPVIKNQFEIKIWVHVSDKFDVVRITREILEFVSNKSYKRTSNFNMLQWDLAKHTESKKFMIVLDDVWDVTTNDCWDKLLGPLRPNHVNPSPVEVTGNTIIVTTRIRTVAESCGTVGSIHLEVLGDNEIRQILKASAFGNTSPDNYPGLHVIEKNIVRELNGNPLAAKTVGRLLRRNLTIDNWINIMKNKEWQSLQHTDGIMYALKLSYDHLPRHLQQCVSYCSLFPKGKPFSKAQLIQIWISQGLVEKSSEKLERKGSKYLAELVNSGFFQQVSMWSSSECFVMHDLMHDLARMVSRTEYATIDGSDGRELAPTIRHLSIVSHSAYSKDRNGNISRNEEFEESLLKVTSRSKLRTLVLIGQYDSHFFKSFKDAFKEAQHLRLLQITSTYADFDNFVSSLVNPTHLRYLKLENEESHGTLPQALGKCYHLQVLDIGSCGTPKIPDDINNLVILRHLVAEKRVCSSIANIGKMTSLQELTIFKVQNYIGFKITQLQCMSELVKLGVSRLENVRTQEEACGACLKHKKHLERLNLSWTDAQNGYYCEYDSDISCENEDESDMSSENEDDGERSSSMDIEIEGEIQTMSHSSGDPNLASEVLDGLEPHHSLKHLRISGYNGAAPPTWISSSLTCLQTLRLKSCGEWQRLSLQSLPLLRKLVLIKMGNATELSIPSLEELVLIELPRLNTCSCTSARDLNSSLRVLKIKKCPVLEVFPLFENCQRFNIEQQSWLSGLSKLTIHDCPCLHVHNPLPPSTTVSKLSIFRVSTLPTMEGSSREMLTIGSDDDCFDEHSDQLIALDDKVLSFHNLRFLTNLEIFSCQNLATISFEGLRQLTCLKNFKICDCPELLSSIDSSELTHEDMVGANRSTLPSLESLAIYRSGITGKWLSLMLQHVQTLRELSLDDCKHITGLSTGEDENSRSNLMSATDAQSLVYPSRDKLLHLPLNLIPSLKKVTWFSYFAFHGIEEGFAGLTSLEELQIDSDLAYNDGNDEKKNGRLFLPQSLGELEIHFVSSLKTLQPYFPGNLTCLKKLHVRDNPGLTSLQLHSCTALQELTIEYCESINSLEGLQSLDNLRLLKAHRCLGDHREDGRCLLPQSLEEIYVHEYYLETLQPCFLSHLTCLKILEVFSTPSLRYLELKSCTALRCLQVTRAASLKSLELQSCIALEELTIRCCKSLATLEGLPSLCSLRCLILEDCPRLSPCLESLSRQAYTLCPRLESLEIYDPSILTTSFCKHLTSLQRLELYSCGFEVAIGAILRDEQESTLQLLTSLQELLINICYDFPAGLHSLPTLKRLVISFCWITRLPEKGLPPSLEELDIGCCSEELARQCRTLASQLNVKINGDYVN